MINSSFGSSYPLLSTLLFLIYWLLIVGVSLRIVTKRRPTSFVVAWLLIIYILPLFGIFLYFLLGEVHLGQKRAKRAREMRPQIEQFIQKSQQFPAIFTSNVSPVAQPLFQLYKAQMNLDAIDGNSIELINNTDDIFNHIILDIEQAKSNIELVFYIWESGGRVDKVEQALINAVNRGVKCRLMLDSAGSRHFFRSSNYKQLKNAGIEIVEVLKVNLFRFLFQRLDLRQHRKMIIIDNHISYTGSMNIVDPLIFKQNEHVGVWVDMMIKMKGPIAILMSGIYACDWEMETGIKLPLLQVENLIYPPKKSGNIAQLIASGPGYKENLIHQALLIGIYSARKEITFTTPYFVPSDDLLHAICTAAQRGVEVNIIIPKKNDSLMVQWASKAFFRELLEAGVNIYQYQNNLLHAKSVLIDKQLSFVGSVNLDMRSLWLNFEITAVIDNNNFGLTLSKLLKQYFSESITVDAKAWSNRPWWQHIIERLFYFFAPLL